MGAYLRLLGSLAQNLARRVGEDLADCAVVCRRGVVYKLRSFRLRYDDVGPTSAATQDCQLQPEKLAALVDSVKYKPWFCELDRKTAQDLVRDGGPGCFLVRPSASTRSLTLTLWHRHRAYNILVRQREDGLLALGSRKPQEMTFHSVEEMVRYYEQEYLILYSGGELTGRTKLKAPPPGLVRNSTTGDLRRELSSNGKRLSEEFNTPLGVRGLRSRSSGSVEIPFSTIEVPEDTNHRRLVPTFSLKESSSGGPDIPVRSVEVPKVTKSKLVLTTSLRTLSPEDVEVPFCAVQRQFDYTHRPSGSFTSNNESTRFSENKSASVSKSLSKSVPKDIHNPLEVSSLPFPSSLVLTHSVPINKRLAASTPNIDQRTLSKEFETIRRKSSDNVSIVEAPPDVPPRLLCSFKGSENDTIISTSHSGETIGPKFGSGRPLPPLPIVHGKSTKSTLSVMKSDIFDC